MKTFFERLRFLRKQQGLSQYKLAELLGVNQASIARMEMEGGTASPKQAAKLAQILGVSAGWLYFGELSNFVCDPETFTKMLSLPLLEFNEIEKWLENQDETTKYDIQLIAIKNNILLSPKSYLIRLDNDALYEPLLNYPLLKNDLIVVNPYDVLISGSFVVAKVKNDFFCRQYVAENQYKILQPLNKSYISFIFDNQTAWENDVKILGSFSQAIRFIDI